MKYLFFLLLPLFLVAQEPVSIHLTEKDGLPDIEFYSMLEDTEGNIWFTCNKGLYRYNGKEFTPFSHPDKRGRSFFNLRLDTQGRIWCNNIAGQFFYIENDHLVFFNDYQKELKGILVDYSFSEHNIFIKKHNAISVINLKNKKIVKEIEDICGTNLGIIKREEIYFLDSDFNLSEYNQQLDLVESHPTGLSDLGQKLGFTSFYYHNESFFMVFQNVNGKNSRIYSFHTKTKKIREITLTEAVKNSKISQIAFVNEDICVITNRGVFLTQLEHNNLKEKDHYLKNVYATHLLNDKNNNLWISSLNNGVWVIPNRNIKRYNTLSDVEILEKKNDSVCFLTTRDGRLLEMNLSSNLLKLNAINEGDEIEILNYNIPTQQLLFSTTKEIVIYDEVGDKKRVVKNKVSLKSVSYVAKDAYLLSSHMNASVLTTKENREIVSKRTYASHHSCISKKKYVVDIEGVKVFDEHYNRLEDIRFNNKPIHAFKIEETNDGTIWLATYEQGVLGVQNGKVTSHLNTENGLSSHSLNTLKATKGSLWIVADNALQCFDTKTKTFKYVTNQDGINSFNISDLEILGNQILFSSNLGVFGFDKTKIFKQKSVPDLYLTGVYIQGEKKDLESSYTLAQEDSNISINFNTINFKSVEHTIYEYKFKGDKSWIALKQGIDFIKFTRLPAGKFIVQLRAKNKFDSAYSKTIAVGFNVLAPFYKRWWFIGLLVLSVIATIIVYFSKKTARLKITQQKELEKERISKALVFSQLENLRSQMNPHFIFNALNSIQDYIILNEKKLARQYLVKFSRLIRIYLEHSQVNEVSLKEEISALQLYLELEKDRFNDDFKFTISFMEQQLDSGFKVPSLFIQPYVENALKHGLLHKVNNKIVHLDFSVNTASKMLVCTIDDNGIGRKASQELKKRTNTHKSFATQANQKRINLLNSTNIRKINIEFIDKVDHNKQALGTKVIIKIPI